MLLGTRYRIVERIGRGGMGEVFRADDLELHERVALKVIPNEVAGDPTRRGYLRREVSLARRVSHPNVCRVHDLGDIDGRLFLSMEYIDGEDLARLVARVGRLNPEKAMEIARQVTAGLAAAHAAGILHRDLKPSNVMLDRRGNARLTDFGLAIVGRTARAGEVAGTPRYMAPEQLAGGPADERTDIYALGLLLYELLAGVPAYEGRTLDELQRSREVPPPPLRDRVHGLDPRVEEIIQRCLSRDRDARPATALAVLTALSGGDPLQAALAAGQTPSPLAVADAAQTGALRPWSALACLALVALTLVSYHGCSDRLSLVEGSRLELPPEALAVRAREDLEALGYPGPWKTEAWGFAYDADAIRYLSSNGGWDALGTARPPAMVFWYRASVNRLEPPAATGRIGETQPPGGAGTVVLRLDPRGRLLRLAALPIGGPPASPVRPEALVALAGADPRHLTPTETRRPPRFADSLSAWQESGSGLRLDAAWLDGRPVHFEVSGPWKPSGARPSLSSTGIDLLIVVGVLVAMVLASRNLRQGRGDTTGAFRVAMVVFSCVLAARVLRADLPAAMGSAGFLAAAVEHALYYGASAWLLYLALEPHVRRVWPQRLVSWTRLLEGRWRDPMVARDVLIGVTVAYGSGALVILAAGRTPETAILNPVLYGLDPLLGFRFAFAGLLSSTADAITSGLLSLVLLLALRVLPVPSWAAAAGLASVLVAGTFFWLRSGAQHGAVYLLILAAVVGFSWIVVLTRVGLLAMMSGMFLELFGAAMPNATRLSGWTASCAWIPLLVGGAITLYGAWFSLGRARFPRVASPAEAGPRIR